MKRHDYYEELKSLARQVREKYALRTSRVLRSDLRRIYKAHGIKFEKWPLSPKIRGAYFNDDCGIHIVIAESLRDDPAVFTMAHELKHHLVDAASGRWFCASANEKEPIEIGAEVFAAELIFPEADFVAEMRALGVEPGGCTPEHIVRLKEITKTTLSHRGLCKRAEWLRFAVAGSLDRVPSWTAVRDRVFGPPPWRRRSS